MGSVIHQGNVVNAVTSMGTIAHSNMVDTNATDITPQRAIPVWQHANLIKHYHASYNPWASISMPTPVGSRSTPMTVNYHDKCID